MKSALALLLLAGAVWSQAPAAVTAGAEATTVLVEAEAFDELGGWVIDQQFMDMMGSPYVLAHGMGEPVADAQTRVAFEMPGRYRVWVRTRDWVAPWTRPTSDWEPPGRFQVSVDGVALATTFGTEGDPWHWQDGGLVDVGPSALVALHDLTGFDGRCDLVVVGGGVAGTSAAVTAARLGLSVALIQDRPVLGGNASSEVRVWPEGHVNQEPYPRVGDVVMELIPDRGPNSRNAQAASVFDDDRKLRVVRAEANITLFLEQRVNAAETTGSSVRSVTSQHVRTGRRVRVRGSRFLDSTGDGALGFLVGADFEQTDTGHMGASNLWNIKCLCEDEDPLSQEVHATSDLVTFPRCPWAVDLSDRPFPGRTSGSTTPEYGLEPISIGNWFWESGFDRDPILDMERVRDQNLRAAYGAWDAIKNVEGRYPAHRLNWLAYIAGKRESRRLLGDVILTGEDLRDGTVFDDGAFPCTWGIDTHHPDPAYSEGHEGEEFIADYTRGEGYEYEGPYWAPYRCLYSRNIDNLFMAGRDISVTHEALGAVRVMKTTGAMGEIVGMAAAICERRSCSPREVYAQHLGELQELMQRGAGRVAEHVPDERGRLTLSARRASIRGREVRYEAGRDALGYWRNSGDFVEWRVNLEAPTRFVVKAIYSCPPEERGGRFEVQFGRHVSAISATVESTGSWEEFALVTLGDVELPAGPQRVSLHNRKESGPLMKLRALELNVVP